MDLASNRRGAACCLPVSERRLNPVASPKHRHRALLPREFASQRVDLGAPRKGERRDVFAECPFVRACPFRGATAGLPALGARRDRHAFGACLDLPFNEAKVTTCLKKRLFHAREQSPMLRRDRHQTVLPGGRGNAVPSGAKSSISVVCTIDDAMSSPAIAPSIKAERVPAYERISYVRTACRALATWPCGYSCASASWVSSDEMRIHGRLLTFEGEGR